MNIPDKSAGSEFDSAEFNQFKNETENAIIASGQALAGNSVQLKQALIRTATNGASGTDSGSANSYIFNSIDTNGEVTEYKNGQMFTLVAGATNTGSSSLTIQGLAAKNIQKNGFSATLEAGDIVAGKVYSFFYSTASGTFELISGGGTGGGTGAFDHLEIGKKRFRVQRFKG